MVKLIETELNAIGAHKISMPILGAKEMWQKTGRWSAFESEMFHLNDKTNQTFCLQPTHEEMVTKLIAEQGNIFNVKFPRHLVFIFLFLHFETLFFANII